ncbi:MAG: nucleoside triphosphate pyrophosphohydrolase [Alphaproteobacteria bacterium]
MTQNLHRLLEIMAKLRDPDEGCPWDTDQTFATIAPYTIEEAYEVADAIERGDMPALKDELGDLLLQVVFHARIAEESGLFDFDDIATAISDKMVRRHPHVYQGTPRDPASLRASWNAIKAEERAAKASKESRHAGTLDDVPRGLPALTRADKLQRRAATVGFDWPEAAQVLLKIREETTEVEEALAGNASQEHIAEEIGDLLFAVANLARHLHIDPEAALNAGNAKFIRRFERIEAMLAAQNRSPAQSDLDEMESLWQRVKEEERGT